MATTFNFELANKPNSKGHFPIYIRITKDRKLKRVRTSIDLVKKAHWNRIKQEVRKSEQRYQQWNSILQKELEEAKAIQRELKQQGKVSLKNIAQGIKEENTPLSFLEYAEKKTEETYQSGEYNTYKKNLTFLIKLKFFINSKSPKDTIKYKGKKLQKELAKLNKDLLFTEIDLDFLSSFHSYLKEQPNSRNPKLKLHTNTIKKQFAQFSSLYNKALQAGELGKQLRHTIKHNPFDDYKVATAKTYKEKLTVEEMQKIIDLNLDKDSLIWHCRNCFLLSYYTAGMRAADLIHLRGTQIQEGRLYYEMDKTEKRQSVKLYPQALEILANYIDLEAPTDKYVFPLLSNTAPYAIAKTAEELKQLPPDIRKMLLQQVNSKNSLINKYLKKMAEMAGISKKITFHIARHSFANIARQKKANLYDISKMLGHSNLKITETYLSNFDEESQDQTMGMIYDSSPKEQLTDLLKTLSNEDAIKLIKQLKNNSNE